MTIPTKLNSKAKSEFGSGLVICLVKFAEHAEKWLQDKEVWKQMREKEPTLFSESHAVELFFYGASDHLYKIEVPARWRGTRIETKVNELRDFAFTIRHGLFTGQEWSRRMLLRLMIYVGR